MLYYIKLYRILRQVIALHYIALHYSTLLHIILQYTMQSRIIKYYRASSCSIAPASRTVGHAIILYDARHTIYNMMHTIYDILPTAYDLTYTV